MARDSNHGVSLSRYVPLQLPAGKVAGRYPTSFILVHCGIFPKGAYLIYERNLTRMGGLQSGQTAKRGRVRVNYIKGMLLKNAKNPRAQKLNYSHLAKKWDASF